MANWKIQKSEYLISDRWLKVRADSCLTEDGKVIEPFYILEYGDWVNCLVIDADLNALMVRQYRHGVQKEILEIISVGLEDSDSSIESGIKRELKEELGYTGGEIYQTGTSYPNPANQTNKVYSFLAFGGKITSEQKLEVGEDLIIEKIKFFDLIKLVTEGSEVLQSMHVANMFYAFNFIKNSDDSEFEQLKIILEQSK